MAVNASQPNPAPSSRTRRTQSPPTPSTLGRPTFATSTAAASTSYSNPSVSSRHYKTSSSSTLSSLTSLSSLRESLSQNPNIYDISEIRSATNNFLAKRYSSSSSSTACWRCTLRNIDTIVFQRRFCRRIETSELKERLKVLCRSNHMSVIRLLGASISGDHIYLVYEFIKGASLADCLRNSRNPNFTVLSTWISRIQVATDLSHALDYIHNKTGLNLTLVHNHIKSRGIIVTEPSFNATLCHFGTAQLCGEVDENEASKKGSISEYESEIVIEDESPKRSRELKRSNSGGMQFHGVKGYISPEFQATGVRTQKSDVYAFGVVILELLSGEEPFKYKYDKNRNDFVRFSVTETARAAIEGGGNDDSGGREGRLRKWVDRRLKDSFPVDVAEKLIRLALECVHVDPDKRPDMGRVAGKISKMYLKSQIWSENFKLPSQISVSLAPR